MGGSLTAFSLFFAAAFSRFDRDIIIPAPPSAEGEHDSALRSHDREDVCLCWWSGADARMRDTHAKYARAVAFMERSSSRKNAVAQISQ